MACQNLPNIAAPGSSTLVLHLSAPARDLACIHEAHNHGNVEEPGQLLGLQKACCSNVHRLGGYRKTPQRMGMHSAMMCNAAPKPSGKHLLSVGSVSRHSLGLTCKLALKPGVQGSGAYPISPGYKMLQDLLIRRMLLRTSQAVNVDVVGLEVGNWDEDVQKFKFESFDDTRSVQ